MVIVLNVSINSKYLLFVNLKKEAIFQNTYKEEMKSLWNKIYVVIDARAAL